MFKFLKVFSTEEKPAQIETMRMRFERVTTELNEVLAELEELPQITLSAADRRIEITAPDQFVDEALALPKPDPVPGPETAPETDATSAPESDGDTAKEPGQAAAQQSKTAA